MICRLRAFGLERCCVERKTGTARRLYFFKKKVNYTFVQVIAAETGVAIGSQHLEHAIVKLENGKIERAAAKVVNCDFRMLFEFIKAVRESRCGWLIQNPLDGKSRQFACALSGVALR